MPVLVLSIGKISIYARYVRAATIQQLSEDYVLFAISKGASRGYILLRHVLKNCLLPVITLVGMNLGSLVSGAYIVETIFGWPGLGTTFAFLDAGICATVWPIPASRPCEVTSDEKES